MLLFPLDIYHFMAVGHSQTNNYSACACKWPVLQRLCAGLDIVAVFHHCMLLNLGFNSKLEAKIPLLKEVFTTSGKKLVSWVVCVYVKGSREQNEQRERGRQG